VTEIKLRLPCKTDVVLVIMSKVKLKNSITDSKKMTIYDDE